MDEAKSTLLHIKPNRKTILAFGLYAASAAILFLARSSMFYAIKGWILMAILFRASLADIKNRECDDYFSVMILLTGLIDIPLKSLPVMLAGGSLIFILQLIFAILRPGKYGGADIKISSACGFLLGPYYGLLALVLGLFTGAVTTKINICKNKSNDKTLPLIPYLSIGTFLAYLLAG